VVCVWCVACGVCGQWRVVSVVSVVSVCLSVCILTLIEIQIDHGLCHIHEC
jgi:hypothetical protein